MQPSQFLYKQCVHIRPVNQWRWCMCALNDLLRVGLRLLHYLPHRLLDRVAVDQKQAGRCQVLLDGLVFPGGAVPSGFGAVGRTAPLLPVDGGAIVYE